MGGLCADMLSNSKWSPSGSSFLSKHRKGTMMCLLFSLLVGTISAMHNAVPKKTRTTIDSLPGYQGKLPFKLETGYIGVGDFEEVQLFYYFIESQRDPARDPLILWLTGGPGCSGLSALLYEVGPFQFDYETYITGFPTLIDNPYSVTQVASMIFIDAPVGTGFSYSTTEEGYYSSDTKSAQDTTKFLQKWLLDHPEYLMNDLYISGDSYSGKLIPMVVENIENAHKAKQLPNIILHGYTMGNPVTDDAIDTNDRVPYAHRVSLISDELYESAKINCKGEYRYPDANNSACLDDVLAIGECLSFINVMHVLEPICTESIPPKPKDVIKRMNELPEDIPVLLNSLPFSRQKGNWCRSYHYFLAPIWANDLRVQAALGVRKGMISDWMRCNRSLEYDKDVESVLDYHRSFFNTTYRALIYSGDQDISITYLATTSWISSFNLTVTDPWRAWYVDGQVAGFTEASKHNFYTLTYATIKGAGHTAPEYKPKQALAMFDRWLSYYYL